MNRYRTFWQRFFALILDGIVLSIVGEILKVIPPPEDSRVLAYVYSVVVTNMPYAYVILMVGRYGQTLGKMALSIQIVDHATEAKIGYYQSFLREAIPMVLVNISILFAAVLFDEGERAIYDLSTIEYIVLFLPSTMLFIWGILEIVTMLMDEKNRALHDKVAGTVVIKC